MFSDGTQLTHRVDPHESVLEDDPVQDVLPINDLSAPFETSSAVQHVQRLEGLLRRFETDYLVLAQRLTDNEENSKAIQAELDSTKLKMVELIQAIDGLRAKLSEKDKIISRLMQERCICHARPPVRSRCVPKFIKKAVAKVKRLVAKVDDFFSESSFGPLIERERTDRKAELRRIKYKQD